MDLGTGIAIAGLGLAAGMIGWKSPLLGTISIVIMLGFFFP